MKQLQLLGMLVFCLVFSGLVEVPQAKACAGYTLVLGSGESLREELLAQILSLLISQRTGTTIQLVRFETQAELLGAASRHEVDLLLAEVDSAAASGVQPQLNTEDLVALEPFNYGKSQQVPVFQAAVLKRFPALKRLVNRLGGLFDEQTLQELEADLGRDRNPRDVAHKFLTEQKLIFGG